MCRDFWIELPSAGGYCLAAPAQGDTLFYKKNLIEGNLLTYSLQMQTATFENARRSSTVEKLVMPNSHRHATHDKTILSLLCPLRRCELDYRQLKTVADRKLKV